MSKVFTNGCFDLLHYGHVKLLEFCKSHGHVIVGLNSDSSISRLKGPSRPIRSQDERKYVLESLKFVDEVHIFNEDTPYELMKRLKPDILVKGGDYADKDVAGSDLAKLIIFDTVGQYSTTNIVNKLKQT